MRSFIAIELEPEIKDRLEEIQVKSKGFSRRGTYTSRENMHINLYFLGEIERDDIQYIQTAMFEMGNRTKAFSLELNEVGFFPKGKTGVMWVGTKKSKELERLFFGLGKSLSRQGFGKDRTGLTPHITIGRDIEPQRGFTDIQKKLEIKPQEFKVKKMTLIESKRRGFELFYKTLYVQEFKEI